MGEDRSAPHVPGGILLFTAFVALHPVPVWLALAAVLSGAGPLHQWAGVALAFALGNGAAALAERRSSCDRADAAARWCGLAALVLAALVALLLAATPLAVEGLRASGVDDLLHGPAARGLLRYWECVVAFLLCTCALVGAEPETAEERARRRAARRTGRRAAPRRGPALPDPTAVRVRHPAVFPARA